MATIKNDIVTTMDAANPSIVEPELYMGTLKAIPIFIDASEALVNNADVIRFTNALPPKTRALGIALNHDSSDGVGASTTLALTAGSTVLTVTATIPTSADTNGTLLWYSLKNTDVSGLPILGTVGGDDWDDDTDLYGYIVVATAQ